MEKRINKIVSSGGLINLDLIDFGDIDKIIFHKMVELEKAADFKLILKDEEKENVKTLLVHVFGSTSVTLMEQSLILDRIRDNFDYIDVIYGTSLDPETKGIVVDVFGKP